MVNPRFYTSDVYAEHYMGIRWPVAVWGAVLQQAIKDAVEGPAEFEGKGMGLMDFLAFSRETRAAAQEWIADEANEPRRFVWVCEQLGLNPAAVRRQVAEKRTA